MQSWLRRCGQVGLLVALAAVVVPQGSPDAISSLTSSILFGLVAMVSIACAAKRPNEKVGNEVVVLGCVSTAYIILQIVSVPGNPFAHDIWLRAGSLLAVSTQSISVEPSSTYAALFPLLTPLIAFYAVVRLFDDDEAALFLLKCLALCGLAFGAYGGAEMFFLPDSSRLTGFFVNRNTSGTFLGIATLASVAWLISAVSGYPRSRRQMRSTLGTQSRQRREAIFAGICVVICLLGIFLTRSRGAMIASFSAFALFVLLNAINGRGLKREWMRNWSEWTRVAVLTCTGCAILLASLEFFGGQTTARMATQGADLTRLCIYAATLEGFREYPLFGTGLGTYATAFQQFRPPECVDLGLVILRGHSTFLEALFCLGLVGLLLFVYAYLHVGLLMLGGYRERRRLRHVPMAGIAGVVLVTVHSAIDFSLQIPGFAVYFACFLGAVASVCVARQARGTDVER